MSQTTSKLSHFINICCRYNISAKICTNYVNISSDKAGNNEIKIIWKVLILYLQNCGSDLTNKGVFRKKSNIFDIK